MKKVCIILIILMSSSIGAYSQTIDFSLMNLSMLDSLKRNSVRHDTIVHTDDALMTMSETGDTVTTIMHNGDTLVTHILTRTAVDTIETISMDDDALLLALVAKQGEELHAHDTIWEIYPHPLCMQLMFIPTIFPSLRDTSTVDEASIQEIRNKARRYVTTHHADYYVSISDTNRLKQMVIDHIEVQRAMVKDFEEDQLDLARALREMDSHWKRELNLSLQITQNYASNNWYQGESNAFSMLAGAKGSLSYKHENISWENMGEWRSGISTVSGDSLRLINTTDDLFRLNSKFGYQIHKQWYVSTIMEFRTNLMNNWRKNTNELSSTFLTPIRFTLGIGADYKPTSNLSINISPAAYKLIYATITDPKRVNVTDFGIPEGENMLNEVGSSLRIDWKWRPLREIKVETYFYFFTNYKRIETELEVNVDFIINRYMSAKVMLHPRYDSTVELLDDRKTKLQFKEVISVGFSHTFR